MRVTIKDIAAELQISTAAVSLALNGKPGVSDAVRKKIIQKATEMHYFRREEAPLPGKPVIRYVIYVTEGTFINSISFHSLVLKGIEKSAQELGYDLLVSYLYENEILEEQLNELRQHVQGLLLLGTEFREGSPLGAALCRISRDGCPVVILDQFLTHSPLDCIATDNYYGASQAIGYLLDKGHRRIGYLSSTNSISNFEVRANGAEAAIKKCRDASLQRIPTRFPTSHAFADISAWLKAHKNEPLPTAFFADSDIIALGALQALAANGLRVPEDISVIGFDDMPECSMVLPSLTTVHIEKEIMGQEGMRLIDRRIREKEAADRTNCTPPLRLIISTNIVERDSVAPV